MRRSFFIPSRLFFYVLAIMALLCLPLTQGAIAIAQDLAVDPAQPGLDIGSLFGSTAALAAFIITVVQFVRAHLWTGADGIPLIVFTFVIGIALAIAGFYMHLLPAADIVAAIAFGFTAALGAVGSVNLLKAVAAKKQLTAGV